MKTYVAARDASRWTTIAGLVGVGAMVISACTSAVLGEGAGIKSYSELSCEQIQAEFARLNRSLLGESSSTGTSGATEAIVLSNPRAAGTARGIDRALAEPDVRHRMEHLVDAHRDKGCPGRLSSDAGRASSRFTAAAECDTVDT